MAFFNRTISCPVCEYEGPARLGAAGITLWTLAVLLIFFSFMFWPLFILWPFLLLLLFFLPVGQVCPTCRTDQFQPGRSDHAHARH